MKTTNFEISKQLKEVGFNAKTDYYWYCYDNGEEMRHIADADGKGNFKSYDLEILLKALPKKIETEQGVFLLQMSIMPFNKDNRWLIGYCKETDTEQEENESLVDTAARLLIKLVQEGIINLKENKMTLEKVKELKRKARELQHKDDTSAFIAACAAYGEALEQFKGE